MSGLRLGVQSYTFRNFKTLSEVIVQVKKAGLEFVEIYPGHMPFDADKKVTADGLKKLKDSGITLDSYGVYNFSIDEDISRKIFQFANMSGLKVVSADIDPDAVKITQELAEEYNVRLAVHNHGKEHRYGSTEQLSALFKKTSKNIGLCLDTAWMMHAGFDPLQAAITFKDRLYGIHLKDFRFNKDGSYADVILGDGKLSLEKFLLTIVSIGFDGYASIEYEGEPDNPLPSITEAVKRVREIFA